MDDVLFGMSESPLIGSYKVTGKIGTGAFSEVRSAVFLADQDVQQLSCGCKVRLRKHPLCMQVFKGTHVDTGQEVALKYITGQFQLRGRNDVGASQKLTRELRAMQHLSHRHIVKLLDTIPQARLLAAAMCVRYSRVFKFCGMPSFHALCALQGDGLVLVLELCAIDLAEALQHTSQRLDEALVKAVLFQLLQGVAALHEAGMPPMAWSLNACNVAWSAACECNDSKMPLLLLY